MSRMKYYYIQLLMSSSYHFKTPKPKTIWLKTPLKYYKSIKDSLMYYYSNKILKHSSKDC